MARVLGLEVLDAAELVVLAVRDELVHLVDGLLGDLPPVQLLLQRLRVLALERAAVDLPRRLRGEADELGAAEGVLALQMPLLAVGVLQVVRVVLLVRRGVDLGVPAELLLPPPEGVLDVEAALLEEGAQLQAACVLQVLLPLALLLHETPHARREGALLQFLEVLQGELLRHLVGVGLRRDQQLHAILLEVAQEATYAWVRERHGESLEGHVQARAELVLEPLCQDKLQSADRHVGGAPLHHDAALRDERRVDLREGHLVKVRVDLGRLALDERLRAGRAVQYLVKVRLAVALPGQHVDLLALQPGGRHEGLFRLGFEGVEAQHEEALLLFQEPVARVPGLAEGKAQGEV
mmetsp:Transcript_41526/g.109578  ORF Transcript_41526/g.109578 Transcript_41526/m.109578 type:complete len:351 (-) Transcript_41526:410-1462(-)